MIGYFNLNVNIFKCSASRHWYRPGARSKLLPTFETRFDEPKISFARWFIGWPGKQVASEQILRCCCCLEIAE